MFFVALVESHLSGLHSNHTTVRIVTGRGRHGEGGVRFSGATLRFRRAMAVIVILIISAGAAYDIRRAPDLQSDGATVIFFVAHQLARSQPQADSINESLVATEVMLSETTMEYVSTPAGKVQIVAFPCNRSNLQYPDYEEQCATLTATAANAAAVRRAFWEAYRVLRSRLLRLQISSTVPARNRIQTDLVGVSGPVAQAGSRARVLAGLAVLTLIGMLTVSRFLTLRRSRAATRRRRFFALHGNRARARRDPSARQGRQPDWRRPAHLVSALRRVPLRSGPGLPRGLAGDPGSIRRLKHRPRDAGRRGHGRDRSGSNR